MASEHAAASRVALLEDELRGLAEELSRCQVRQGQGQGVAERGARRGAGGTPLGTRVRDLAAAERGSGVGRGGEGRQRLGTVLLPLRGASPPRSLLSSTCWVSPAGRLAVVSDKVHIGGSRGVGASGGLSCPCRS